MGVEHLPAVGKHISRLKSVENPFKLKDPLKVIDRIEKQVSSEKIKPKQLIADADFLLQEAEKRDKQTGKKAGEEGISELTHSFLQQAFERTPFGTMQIALADRLEQLDRQYDKNPNPTTAATIRRHLQMGEDLGVNTKPEGQEFLDIFRAKYPQQDNIPVTSNKPSLTHSESVVEDHMESAAPELPELPEQNQLSEKEKAEEEIKRRYQERADKLQVAMPEGDFMSADGGHYTSFWNEEGYTIPSYLDPEEVEGRLTKVGKFYGNDGALTFVGPDGRYWIGPGSDKNVEALEKTGFKRDSHVGNLMNSGYKFVEPELQEQWDALMNPYLESLEARQPVRLADDLDLSSDTEERGYQRESVVLPESIKGLTDEEIDRLLATAYAAQDMTPFGSEDSVVGSSESKRPAGRSAISSTESITGESAAIEAYEQALFDRIGKPPSEVFNLQISLLCKAAVRPPSDYRRRYAREALSRLYTGATLSNEGKEYLKKIEEEFKKLKSPYQAEEEIMEADKKAAETIDPKLSKTAFLSSTGTGEEFDLSGQRFQITDRLSAGRYGTVYLAEAENGKRIVVKVRNPDLDDVGKLHFEEEMYTLVLLADYQRRHNLTVDGELLTPEFEEGGLAGKYAANKFFAMGFADGVPLDEIFRSRERGEDNEQLTENEAVIIGEQFCRVLEALHSLNKSYLDFQPRNVFWDQAKQKITVIDWNLLSPSARGEEGQREMSYAQPEMDLQTVGILMLRLTTDATYGDTEEQGAAKVVEESSISPNLKNVLFKVFDKNPDARFQSAQELRQALIEILSSSQ